MILFIVAFVAVTALILSVIALAVVLALRAENNLPNL